MDKMLMEVCVINFVRQCKILNLIYLGYLSHVIETFEYAGIERTFDADKWDFMWSHYYPFGDTKRHGQMLKTLGSGRRLNKIPGTGWISRFV